MGRVSRLYLCNFIFTVIGAWCVTSDICRIIMLLLCCLSGFIFILLGDKDER